MIKKCKICTKDKNVQEFYKLNLKDQRSSICKDCTKDKQKLNIFRLNQKIQKEILLNQSLKKCAKCIKIKSIQDFYDKSSYCKTCQNVIINNYRKTEKGKIALKKIRSKSHNQLINSLRSRINLFFKGKNDQCSLKLLGCTVLEWKQYLEAQFKPGMTWDNYGIYWEVDHTYPLSKALKISKEELYKAFHYNNTRPLTCTENAIKKDKIL